MVTGTTRRGIGQEAEFHFQNSHQILLAESTRIHTGPKILNFCVTSVQKNDMGPRMNPFRRTCFF